MDFILNQNIRRFRRMLGDEADPRKRSVITTLLREEQAKLLRDLTGRDAGKRMHR